MKTARQVAFDVIYKILTDKAYSNLTLDSVLSGERLDNRDAALTGAIVYGVLERMLTIDYNLSKYLSQPIKKLRPEVHVALLIGAYQILYMDKIPVSAAVNESVKLAINNRCKFASGLVNAVLRKVASYGEVLPDPGDNCKYLSVKYSCSEEIVSLWLKAYGRENTMGILENSIGNVPTVLRVNTTKITSGELIEKLSAEGITALPCKEVEDALTIEHCGSLEAAECYKQGLFHVQDTASQLCCKALDAREGQRVLDLCSAPGGKSFTLAERMNNIGTVCSFDIYEHRVNLISKGAERLGLTCIKPQLGDASVFNEKIEKADRVLCDVPCSGLGIIRRKPEIKYKKFEDIDKLPDLQYLILCNSSLYLKKGGILVYSTCALDPAENDEVCDRFLAEHPEFCSVEVLNDLRDGNSRYITLMPHKNNSDGFFIAAFTHKA
ncbi:MAG: 16S rRNA (cytosine(967)-C(5))-methyltransferase RsmB [Clostridiales bacterium]|nr:16S rRNA (cytosine(967)-C(5))-methyltransferase RsmB [Clostridiales bacterium]